MCHCFYFRPKTRRVVGVRVRNRRFPRYNSRREPVWIPGKCPVRVRRLSKRVGGGRMGEGKKGLRKDRMQATNMRCSRPVPAAGGSSGRRRKEECRGWVVYESFGVRILLGPLFSWPCYDVAFASCFNTDGGGGPWCGRVCGDRMFPFLSRFCALVC